jgi:hypothetical protein
MFRAELDRLYNSDSVPTLGRPRMQVNMPSASFMSRRTVKPLYSTTTRTRTVPVTEEDENGDLQETGTFKTETYKERVLSQSRGYARHPDVADAVDATEWQVARIFGAAEARPGGAMSDASSMAKPQNCSAFERHAKTQLLQRVGLDDHVHRRWKQSRARPMGPRFGNGLLDGQTVDWAHAGHSRKDW